LGFVAKVEQAMIPAIIQSMVTANLQVFAVQPFRKTLEDQFLEMTGGGQIAESHKK